MQGNFTRREVLIGMGAAGMTPWLIGGCSSSGGGYPPLPTDLPVYEPVGPVAPETPFKHGVASGDPLVDGVIIWTRVTPDGSAVSEPIEVFWEMALDEGFAERTAAGTAITGGSKDFTIKVDVPALLWGRNYYYRFALQGHWSVTGRTRLTPRGNGATQLRFGVCACSSYGRGWFHGYRHLAERAELDAVVHLGDYTYEYGNDDGFPFIRDVDPPHETVTLEDYRTRLSQHRRDPDLQECHRQHPFIVVWDDHESANDSWMGGAENHNPEDGEGSWEDRLAAARQAFFEWIPLRERPDQQIYRTIKYGDLADIIMLDTRIEGREEQCGNACTGFFADDPGLSENIISATQEAWVQDQLLGSTAKWKILGSQVPMSLWILDDPTVEETQYLYWDQWHAYPEGRARMMSFLRDNNIANVVVVAGDVHSSWAMDVTVGDGSYDPETRDGAVAVEFVAPGITPPSSLGIILPSVVSGSPHVRYAEFERKGYFVLDVRPEKVQADWYLLDGVEENQGNQSLDASWAVLDGQKHVVEMDRDEMPDGTTAPPAS